MIPDYQTFMTPLLELVGRQTQVTTREAYQALADHYQLTEEERQRKTAGNTMPVFVNKIAWARMYLTRAGLLDSPSRGIWRITEEGRRLLAEKPPVITNRLLARYPSFVAFVNASRSAETVEQARGSTETAAEKSETPEESIAGIHYKLEVALRFELLARIKSSPPAFFEQLIVELMLKMGYGGSREDAGQVVGKSGDGGIDGVIKQDRLGLDTIYLQAKRWEGVVGRPDVQAFVGSLAGHRAKRGVFITTSSYSKQALDYVSSIEARVILLDGEQLATLMIEHDLGVSPIATYVVKRVDGDYFEW